MDLLSRVRQFVRQHALADASTRVVVALSGGSDSVALAHVLRELTGAGELQVVGVAHFNHQLRPSADTDERFTRAAAESLGWPIFCDREDVAARARRERRSIEHAAHAARHAFFERARQHFQADVVALGHTRDDQAETVLLRLLRGAGPRGLAAMRPRRGPLVRPLLACRRAQLRSYLRDRHVAFVDDESNADTSIPRNRVRAELLPLLESRFNPNIVDVLADEAEIARETADWMETSADVLLAAAGRPEAGEGRLALDIDTLLTAPAAVRRLAVWRAMRVSSAGRTVAFGHVEAVLRLMQEDGGRVDAPGHQVHRLGSRIVLTRRPPGTTGRWEDPANHANPSNLSNRPNRPNRPNRSNLFKYPLSIPGEVALPEAGCVVSAERAVGSAARALVSNGSVALVRSDSWTGGLAVRNRRPGDRFSPAGVGGRKKLQDFFVDRKVARPQRDWVPLVVDETDRIVWVAGYGIDEAFRVTD
ncbi:MAG: tRNA lysidine(34) synthetase TilS, partial [Acidobacteria bacterium]|nr:tRNA lysidine(34) synthetase TilS [Acidobacteriota bacterium]